MPIIKRERRENTVSPMLPDAVFMHPTPECALLPDLFQLSFWSATLWQVSSHLSVKDSLCAKISSAFIYYAADHRLHQYNFDKQWSTVTAALNLS